MDTNNGQKQLDLNQLTPAARKDIESWIVNTVKLKLIKNFEAILETPGRSNLRQLFLVPIFTINELTERVKDNAPELLTVYFKTLFSALDEAGHKLS